MNQNNPYRAYWEKSQEQSLKLAQYYTPKCLVELCIALLQPKGELFDPCCGLGSFLLKAKEKNLDLKISGNDIAKDLGELPFEFTNSDYLNNGEDREFDYIIANIPFNLKKTHCQLVNENFCWIEKIIRNTRKKSLIILPNIVGGGLNPKQTAKRKQIIESGVLELALQLPTHLFNQVGLSVTLWLIDKTKTSQDVNLLDAEKFSEWKDKKRFISEENIQQICDKNNWIKADLERIKENNFCLLPQRFEPLDEKEEEQWEINQQIIKHTYELRYSLHALIADAYHKLMVLEDINSEEGEIQLQNFFVEGKRVAELQEKIRKLLLEKYF